jgi:hypothetical protein
MKLAVLAARIDAARQIGQQLPIEFAAREFRRQLFQIDSREISFHSTGDHRLRQRQGWPLPQRKHRCDAGAGQLLLPVSLDFSKEQIAEDDVADAFLHCLGDSFPHARFVNRVRTGIGNRHDARRQSCGLTLRLQDLLPHAVDRHPPERLGHRRQCADDIEFTRAPDLAERERAVLAARP